MSPCLFPFVVLLLSVLPGPAWACGPWFPNTLLDRPDEELLWAPGGDLEREIGRINVPATLPFRAVRPGESQSLEAHSDQVDARELGKALEDSGMSQQDCERALATYLAAKAAIRKYAGEMEVWRIQNSSTANQRSRVPAWPVFTAPTGLPGEFADYFAGAVEYHHGRFAEARKCWERLLKRPAEERRHRSTWAAFMIGRAMMLESGSGVSRLNRSRDGSATLDNSDVAIGWFRKVRELAGAEYEDSLGLASASLGWEAKVELDRRHYEKAVYLYLLQYATGDKWAALSLRDVCQAIEKDAADLTTKGTSPFPAVDDPLTRQVMMAYLLAQGGRFHPAPARAVVTAWLGMLEKGEVGQLDGADRLAQIAYQAGEMGLAARWVARAKDDAPMAMWIRAKLLMREGKMGEAAPLLAKASAMFARGEEAPLPGGIVEDGGDEMRESLPADRAAAELGVVQASRGQYVLALDNLIRGGSWLDAAYLAERVLSVEELIKYVDAACPDDGGTAGEATGLMWAKGPRLRAGLRYLLGRRLTRLGRWKLARAYYPAKLRERLDAYVGAIRAGHDTALHRSERAENLWQAARIARQEGMELLGTELGPDYACVAGDYENISPALGRIAPQQAEQHKLAIVPADEKGRVEKSAPVPNLRFHYRYLAADHAWAAAELMPDEADETALVLFTAGSWLKDRDRKAADRFYKALVNRCATTDLGRKAERVRWFW